MKRQSDRDPKKRQFGAEGFEPPTYCSQSSRASQAALCSDLLRTEYKEMTTIMQYYEVYYVIHRD